MSSHICQSISLKGSTDLITEFFRYAVNAILFQRGAFPADDFHIIKKYGQTVIITQDLALESYLEQILKQIGTLLLSGVTQLVVEIVSKDSRMPLEQWVFDVNLVEQSLLQRSQPNKPEAKIQAEICSILRQIVSTVTFLPIIDEPTAFNILVYTHGSADVPANKWLDTDLLAMEGSKSQDVKLRSFSTDVHRVEAMVLWFDEDRLGHPVTPLAACSYIAPVLSLRYPGSSIMVDSHFENSLTKKQAYRWNGKEYTKGGRSWATITIDMLPDVALLEIFDFYGDDAYDMQKRYYERIEVWHTLVHVCRKWRNIVFGSPRRLDLRLHCTSKTPVRKTLDVWPLLPIIIWELGDESWDTDNIVAALDHNDRIRELHFEDIRSSQLEKVLAAMQRPFPALMHLRLQNSDDTSLVIPASFLDASAPRLQSLALIGIPLPTLPKLLLSTTHLVSLCLWKIPHFGYIQPEAMITCLSVLTRLERLELKFESPRCRPNRQRPPQRTRILLPVLTTLLFKGVSEYLEDLVARIDTPLLKRLDITFFHQLIFDTPQLAQFIGRTQVPKGSHNTAHVQFSEEVSVEFIGQSVKRNIKLEILCRQSDWQLSSLAQFFDTSLHALALTVERLFIRGGLFWQDDIDGSQWLDLLHTFTAVKDLHVVSKFMPGIAPTLQEPGGSVTEVLPALQNLLLGKPDPSGPVQEAIEHFVAARQLANRPIGISRWE